MVKRSKKYGLMIQTIIVVCILVLLNVLSRSVYSFIDLTEDKRFTLTNSTKTLLEDVDNLVYIDVLLDGNLPSGFVRLKNRTEEIIKQLRSVNPNIEYHFRDPSKGTVEEINKARETLRLDGIFPVNLFVQEEDQKTERLIYPFALVRIGNRKITVNLLDAPQSGEAPEYQLNRSANSLEYKFASALEKLFKKDEPTIFITTGDGELEDSQMATFEQELSTTMSFVRVNLDSIYVLDKSIDVLIVARPREALSEKNKFVIDQYIMNGGQVIWIIEQYFVNVDSLNLKPQYVPKPVEHGLDDMFFKYGVRFRNDLILDLQNSRIPQVIGRQGGKAQQELFPWVYHPLLQSSNKHPIVKNIDRVFSNFPSTIDLLPREDLKQVVLLNSSQYSRFQLYPMRLSFEIIKLEQRPEAYNKPNLPAAVMVEGEFESFYKNRVTQNMKDGLTKLNAEFKVKSPQTTQIFISDAEIIKNLYNPSTGQISPMGFNKWEGKNGYEYNGNKEFMINVMDYLTDEYGLLEARSKNLQLRLLDQVRIKKEGLYWQILNVVIPTLLVILFGFGFNFFRKRKYSK